MAKKQEYEGGWCGYKFCFTNNYWIPKTNTDAILANPCRHCPSLSLTKCHYPPTRLEVRADETFWKQLSTPENKTSSQIAKAVCTTGDWTNGVFRGAWVYRTVDSRSVARGVEEVRVPPHSLPPPKVGNPDLGLSRSAWCKLNHLRTRVGRFRESLHRWKMAPDLWCPSMRILRSPNRGTCHKWTLWLFVGAWSECKSCFTPTGSVRLVRRKWSCSLTIRTTTTSSELWF